MNRSGYSDDVDPLQMGRWRAQVNNSIRSKRGQAFLAELATAMDQMPDKNLVANELITNEGDCCAIGVVCKSRGIDVFDIDAEDPEEVGWFVDIAHQMAAEIAYENDAWGEQETPEDRWRRMRKWVDSQIEKGKE